MSRYPTYRMFGEHAILLNWPEKIDLDIHDQVFLYARFISENFPDEIVETAIAYQSLVVYLKSGTNAQLFIDTLIGRKIDVSELVTKKKNSSLQFLFATIRNLGPIFRKSLQHIIKQYLKSSNAIPHQIIKFTFWDFFLDLHI